MLENGQTGKASDAEKGDWLLIKSRNPKAIKESERIDDGFHYFDEVVGFSPSGDRLLSTHGSIAPNTIVKKTASFADHEF